MWNKVLTLGQSHHSLSLSLPGQTHTHSLMVFEGKLLTFGGSEAALWTNTNPWQVQMKQKAAGRLANYYIQRLDCNHRNIFPFIAWYAYRIWHMSMTEVELLRSHHGQWGVWVQKVVNVAEDSRVFDTQIPGRWSHTQLNNIAISIATFSFPPNIDKMCWRNAEEFW